jgi:translation initiation factor 2 beta subunit (eIF-2beta)/eIF-5
MKKCKICKDMADNFSVTDSSTWISTCEYCGHKMEYWNYKYCCHKCGHILEV